MLAIHVRVALARIMSQIVAVDCGSLAAKPLTKTIRRPKKSTSCSVSAPGSGLAAHIPRSAACALDAQVLEHLERQGHVLAVLDVAEPGQLLVGHRRQIRRR